MTENLLQNVFNLSPPSGSVSVQNPPTLRGSFEDGDWEDRGILQFEIRRASNNQIVATGSGNQVGNHQVSIWTVPNGVLIPGVLYKWKARGYDGWDYGP